MTLARRVSGAASSCCRVLLAAFPPAFRGRHGAEVYRVLRQRLRDAESTGASAVVRLALAEATDLAATAAVLHWRRLRSRAGARRRAPAEPLVSVRPLLQDLGRAVRGLRQRPGFTIVAVLSLALGIGATTAVFSVLNGALLRPLPFTEPDRLMVLREIDSRGNPDYVSALNFLDWREQSTTFSHLALWSVTYHTLTGRESPRRVEGARVSASLLDLLGAAPSLGRGFRAAEETPGRDRVVVLGHPFWVGEFGADPAVLGRSVTLNGENYIVVGVMPAGFVFPDRPAPDFYRPFAPYPWERDIRAIRTFNVVGRLAPGVGREAAESEFAAIAAQLGDAHPETNAGWTVGIVQAQDALVGRSGLLVLLMGAVGFVLVIACSNIAGLLLSRAREREKEFAIRSALGARRRRIAGQLFAESLVLTALGGAAGLLLAAWGSRLLVALDPGGLPQWHRITVDGSVLAFSAAVTVATALVFGLAPVWHATRPDLVAVLHDGAGRATVGRTALRARRALVVAEVALALVLLAGAGLLTASFARLLSVEPGFDQAELLTGRVELNDASYDDARALAFYRALVTRTAAIPGVRSVGLVTALPMDPLGTDYDLAFAVEGREPPMSERPQVSFRQVDPGYMTTMGIPLLAGRQLTNRDGDPNPPVVLVNEALADRYLHPDGAVGTRISLGTRGEDEPYFEVVGVVGNVRHRGLDQEVRAEVYLPTTVWTHGEMTLVVRTAGDPAAYAGAVRRVLASLDPNIPLSDVATMRDRVTGSAAQRRTMMVLLLTLAGIGVVIAGVGIYGVISHDVAQRRSEIAIRMAMGASRRDVVALIVGQGVRLLAAGILLGGLTAALLVRAVEGLLFEVSVADPLTHAMVVSVLALIAVIASYVPARRATRLDPASALRG